MNLICSVLYSRLCIHAELNEYEQAIEDFSKAIELNPNYAGAYYNRGIAYAKLNQHERAIEDYNKAIELNPASCGGLRKQRDSIFRNP
ncbi:MAG: hypothetical protein MW690_001296 [Methanophagales archaeon]|nr:tetratricopeptide repeat protein [Methanophagales archaeon]MCU4139364.1 hypothetical protein [Methanophagales archaeon]